MGNRGKSRRGFREDRAVHRGTEGGPVASVITHLHPVPLGHAHVRLVVEIETHRNVDVFRYDSPGVRSSHSSMGRKASGLVTTVNVTGVLTSVASE